MSWNLTSLQIENFKCFRKLEVKPLARVNLIVGGSNVGKTAVLEALRLLPQKNGENPFDTQPFRDSALAASSSLPDKWTFYRLDESLTIKIRAVQQSRWLQATVTRPMQPRQSPNYINSFTVNSDKMLFWQSDNNTQANLQISTATTTRQKAEELAIKYDYWTRRPENDERFVEFLKGVDPRLKSLRPMEHTGRRMLYADVHLPERIALPRLGEGFNRLVEIIGAIIGEEADIVLIDEIENGLHWSALPQIWKGIQAAVKEEDVQIFATTHSYECIRAAMEVFKGPPLDDLAVHRLERGEDGDIRCITMDEEALGFMLSSGWEVR